MAGYEFSIVTFLDILGFRDLVMTADATVVNSKLEALERFTRPSSSAHTDNPDESYEPIILQFSDAVVRIRRTRTKWNQRHPIGLVFAELLDLVHAQGELIREGVLIRGGVSCGPIYTSEGRVFGPALVAAYELESRFALYPRIVIDPALLSEYRNNALVKAAHHALEVDEGYISRLIRRGDDGIWFVDYVRAVESELDEPEMYPDFLQMHRKLIIEGAKRFTGLSGPMGKYLWLASYHNELVSQLNAKWLKNYELKRKNVLISAKDIPVLQEVRSNLAVHRTRRKYRAGERTRCAEKKRYE
jgi:hypothetical protein